MKDKILLLLPIILLTGCGKAERISAKVFCNLSTNCQGTYQIGKFNTSVSGGEGEVTSMTTVILDDDHYNFHYHLFVAISYDE